MNSFYYRIGLVAVAAVLTGSLSSIAWADAPSCRGGKSAMMRKASHGMHGHGTMTSHLLRDLLKHKQDLSLTDPQIAQLRSLALDADRSSIRARAEVAVTERELRSMMWDDKVEMSAIEAKVKEHESMEAAVRIIGIKSRRDLLGVLTPEQRTKRTTLHEEMRHGSRASMHRAAIEQPTDTEESTEDATAELELSQATGDPSAG